MSLLFKKQNITRYELIWLGCRTCNTYVEISSEYKIFVSKTTMEDIIWDSISQHFWYSGPHPLNFSHTAYSLPKYPYITIIVYALPKMYTEGTVFHQDFTSL